MTNSKPTQPRRAADRVDADASCRWTTHVEGRRERTQTAVASMLQLAGTRQGGNPAVEMT